MKLTFHLIVLALTFTLCSCTHPLMGPPLPERYGTEVLTSEKVSPATIDKIVNYEELSPTDFENFSEHDDINVRFLIARNPYAPKDILNKLMKDDDMFVRQGVAGNKAITKDMSDTLKEDRHSVRCSLVMNPSVPEKIILDLYRTQKGEFSIFHRDQHAIPLRYYARNPKCPESIKADILKSGDANAMRELATYSPKTQPPPSAAQPDNVK